MWFAATAFLCHQQVRKVPPSEMRETKVAAYFPPYAVCQADQPHLLSKDLLLPLRSRNGCSPLIIIKFPVFQNVPAPPNVLHGRLYCFTEPAEYGKEKTSLRLGMHKDSHVLPWCLFQEMTGSVWDTNILSFKLLFRVSVQYLLSAQLEQGTVNTPQAG